MEILNADQAAIEKAARVLREGGLVAMPTETVYGLAANAQNDRSVARIFEAKGRPRFNPLIVHIPDVAAAEQLAVFNDTARQLAETFWPGPLTLVLPRKADSGLSELVTAGLSTVALRVPGHPTTQALLRAAGVPVAAPSANRSGHISPTSSEHVAADLDGRIDMILDGGPCNVGVESTVVTFADDEKSTPVLLRPGGITPHDIQTATGLQLRHPENPTNDTAPRSPGQLTSHYAPTARLRLNVSQPEPGEALLAFGSELPPHCGPMVNLSATGDLQEAAANLFAALRDLDQHGCNSIAAMKIPKIGLGIAINDRLLRAAAPKVPDGGK
ncbi:MAG: L-threonylcarbamoyladenylate synthase [Filomicrobium sp.]